MNREALFQLFHRGAKLFDEICVVPNLPLTVRIQMLKNLAEVMLRVRPDSINDKMLLEELQCTEEVMGLICAVYKVPNFTLENRIRMLHCAILPPAS